MSIICPDVPISDPILEEGIRLVSKALLWLDPSQRDGMASGQGEVLLPGSAGGPVKKVWGVSYTCVLRFENFGESWQALEFVPPYQRNGSHSVGDITCFVV